MVSLAAVLGVLWLLQRRLSRRTAGSDREEPVRVIAKQGLGGKANLVVVEAEGTRYILGITERGISVVDRVPLAPARVPAAAAAPAPLGTIDAQPDDRELTPPLPLRRTLHHGHAAGTGATRAVGRSAAPTRGAAQALRRALGA